MRKRLRIYPDVHEPGIFCTDEGTNETERRFDKVFVVKRTLKTGYDGTANNKNEPKYWLECNGKLITLKGIGIIF
jgi:hypothetical protein